MPRKKLLVGGALAILLALTAYLITMPGSAPNAPVSREEFTQDMQQFDFGSLSGTERREAISHLRSMAENMPAGQGRRGFGGPGPRRSEGGGGMRRTMEGLEPDERREIMQPMRERSEQERAKQMDEFFEKSPEEQAAELDRMIDRTERFREMREQREAERKKQGKGQTSSPDRRRRRGRSPDRAKARSLARLNRSDSTSRAKRQEFFRRLAQRTAQRKQTARKASFRAATRKVKETKEPKPITDEIVVEATEKGALQKLKENDPVTLAILEDEPLKVIVARAGRRIGELPKSKQPTYSDYMADKRSIWAKVLAVDAQSNYLVIQTTVSQPPERARQ